AAEWSFVDDPAVDIEIDQVAVAGRDPRTREYREARMLLLVEQKRLVDVDVEAGIAVMPKRHSVARRAGERDAVRIEAQIAEAFRIPPAAEAVRPLLVRVVWVVT